MIIRGRMIFKINTVELVSNVCGFRCPRFLQLAVAFLFIGTALLADENAPEPVSDHWAFNRIERPAVPKPENPSWSRTPLDHFVLSQMQQVDLEPASEAAMRVLMRRLYFDLTGLPPTPSQQSRFLSDKRPDAYERLVDELLASPRFGERWGRHWLDVVRYAESNGYERDGTKPNAYLYRYYVIRAFNSDVPYNDFVVQQIAGDEIANATVQTRIATTFLRLGVWDDEPADAKVDRYDQLDDVLGVTASTFLAITLRCARCHDHKFEPFSQREYYQALSVFNPLIRPQNGRTDLPYVVASAERQADHKRELDAVNKQIDDIKSQLEAQRARVRERLLDELINPPDPERPEAARSSLSKEFAIAFRKPADERSDAEKQILEKHSKHFSDEVSQNLIEDERRDREPLEAELAVAENSKPQALPQAYVFYEKKDEIPETRVLERGSPFQPADVVEPGVPKVLGLTNQELPAVASGTSGRRLWFANWIANRENPLTARVVVNRVFQHYFGDGIVATENDFGVMGDFPTHQALLDYLASDLIENDWQLKKLHRQIVLSSTYRQESRVDDQSFLADEVGSYLSRFRQRRLDAEVVRDTVLAVTGRLNNKMFGPSYYPTLPKEVLDGQSVPGKDWGKSSDEEQSRRSIYIFAKRSLAIPELDLLDSPGSEESCEQRSLSITGPQALTFINGEFFNQNAGYLAERLMRDQPNNLEAQIQLAFRLLFARKAQVVELDRTVKFVHAQTESLMASDENLSEDEARMNSLAELCLVLLNTTEFTYQH